MKHAFSIFIKRIAIKLLAYVVSTICKLCCKCRKKLLSLEEVIDDDNQ